MLYLFCRLAYKLTYHDSQFNHEITQFQNRYFLTTHGLSTVVINLCLFLDHQTFVKIGEGNKRGEGDFSYHISSISGLGNFFFCFFIIKLLSKLELTFQECQNGLLSIIKVTSPIYNYFTLLFLKRNKQKVYGHSLADSRRISRLIHAWSRTEKAFSVLF